MKIKIIIFTFLFYNLTSSMGAQPLMGIPPYAKETIKRQNKRKVKDINYELLATLTNHGLPKDLLNLTLEYLTLDFVKTKTAIESFIEVPYALAKLDSQLLYCGCFWRSIRVLDAMTEEFVWSLEQWSMGRKGPILSISDTKNGTIASCDTESKIVIWDLKTGKAIKSKTILGTSGLNRLACLHDGKIVVGTNSNQILVYDANLNHLKTINPDAGLRRSSDSVTALLEYLPNILISGGTDGAIRLWDVQKKDNFSKTMLTSSIVAIKIDSDHNLLVYTEDGKVHTYSNQAEAIKTYQAKALAKKRKK